MFPKSTYIARRQALLNHLRANNQSGVVLLLGNSEEPRNYAGNTYAMRQDSTFLYYFGLDRHDLCATLDIDSEEVVVWGNDYTLDDFIWMGELPSVRAQAAEVGVEVTHAMGELDGYVATALKQSRTVHYLPPYRAKNKATLSALLGGCAQPSEELIKAVVAGREIKDDLEIEQMHRACDIGNEMHREAMRLCGIGVAEREVAGAIEGVALRKGSGVSFHSIVSQRGQVLHNHDHSGILSPGRLLLVDAGAENVMNYCSDHTRTLPVAGKFTQKQKDIYTIVYDALQRGQNLVREGITYQSIQVDVARGMVEQLVQLGLMKGSVEDAVLSGAVAMFMPHGLGHQIGLDVHDMEDLGEKFVGYNQMVQRSTTPGLASLRMGKELRAGHAITVEPGVYFVPALIEKWKSEGKCAEFINYDRVAEYLDFGGIRLENTVLVTKDGMVEMGAERPPLTIEEVEQACSK